MQKQFTATGWMTLFAVAAAGILLTAHLQRLTGLDNSPVSSVLLWIVELLAYLAVLSIWVPRITSGSLVAGIFGLFVMRLFIGSFAGIVYSFLDSSKGLGPGVVACLSGWLPRCCSLIFAILAFYPARLLLSSRTIASKTNRTKSRFGEFGARTTPVQEQDKKDDKDAAKAGTFLFGVSSSSAASGGKGASGGFAASVSPAADKSLTIPEHLKDAVVAIPLANLVEQFPAGILHSDVIEKMSHTSMKVEIPLAVIAPQLKEAQVQITVAALLSFMPKEWNDTPMSGGEEKLSLPLELIVPQIPEELFKLPNKTSPAWASLSQEDEKILFAQV